MSSTVGSVITDVIPLQAQIAIPLTMPHPERPLGRKGQCTMALEPTGERNWSVKDHEMLGPMLALLSAPKKSKSFLELTEISIVFEYTLRLQNKYRLTLQLEDILCAQFCSRCSYAFSDAEI